MSDQGSMMSADETDMAPADPAADGVRRDWTPGVLATLAMAWLAAVLWSAHKALAASTGVLALNEAALALPTVVSAGLVTGVAVGFAAAHLLGRRIPRIAAGLGGGLLTGLVVAALILVGYGTTSALVALAAGVGAASLLGGAISTVRPPALAGAAVAGALAWFVLSLLANGFASRLLTVFGADGSTASQANAAHRLTLTLSVAGGLVAGLVAYRYLRPRAEGQRWPTYLAGGAGPGLLLLLADLVALVVGARLRSLAAASSEADRAVLSWFNTVGLNTAMVVLFVGATTAMIAFGRTLRPETEAESPETESPETESPETGRDQTS
ncbi:hypothetical protein HC028_10660 [Planosporangium flavigriseum]|uniref:Uncharacterized protein n=1 Tax=Planosporangium flavigriseum TaxID=373681 RepID=A0A8J3PME6_9ACTN|nr:hypothetical protein [Planosporangium flavigriseum]NJC64961.1 hypothetical protein [Planosporangium flavigriseum]GIG72836.1 hypothetical protein Pfl04_12400 [Planosporangium flavigriseum]